MEITVNVTDTAKLAALSKARQAFNAGTGQNLSEVEYVQKLFDGQLSGLVDSYIVVDISKVAFLSRMTQEERIAIREAAKVDPAVFDYMELLNASPVITLTDPRTIGGINALETGGLLQPGRAAQILAL